MTRDAPNGRCSKCGGPILGDGGVEQDGETVHAVCSVTEHGDPDMNPRTFREEQRRRDALAHIRSKYGSVQTAPEWLTRRVKR